MAEDKTRNFVIISLWNLLPTITFHLILGQFWSSNRGTVQTSLTLFEMMFTMFFLPPALLVANHFLKKKYDITSRIGVFIIMTITLGTSTILHFKNWADSVGNWNNPDMETIGVMQFEFMVGYIIVLVATIIRYFQGKKTEKSYYHDVGTNALASFPNQCQKQHHSPTRNP